MKNTWRFRRESTGAVRKFVFSKCWNIKQTDFLSLSFPSWSNTIYCWIFLEIVSVFQVELNATTVQLVWNSIKNRQILFWKCSLTFPSVITFPLWQLMRISNFSIVTAQMKRSKITIILFSNNGPEITIGTE